MIQQQFSIILVTGSPPFTSDVGFLKKLKHGAINYTARYHPTKLLLSVFRSHLLVCVSQRVVSRKYSSEMLVNHTATIAHAVITQNNEI